MRLALLASVLGVRDRGRVLRLELDGAFVHVGRFDGCECKLTVWLAARFRRNLLLELTLGGVPMLFISRYLVIFIIFIEIAH